MEAKRSRATGSLYKIRNNRSALHLTRMEMEEPNRSRTFVRSVVENAPLEVMSTDFDGQEIQLPYNLDTDETCTIAPSIAHPLTNLNDQEDLLDTEDNVFNDDQDSEHDDSLEHIADDLSMRDELRSWAISTNQTHQAINSLLGILRKKTDFPLPKDARTLMRTPTNTGARITTIEGGRFWYHGISNRLQEYFSQTTSEVQEIWVDFSMDGLPLHNSGPTEFWPILMKLCEMPDAPVMVVAIFCGPSKPTQVEQYLRAFVSEINLLQESGISINGCKYKVCLRAIIADSPARAFIKGVVSYNGKSGCIKCEIVGTYDSTTRRMYYEGVGALKRTDIKFRNMEYHLHILRSTPLTDILKFDMIMDIIIADRLHLIDLGVMRKLLNGWLHGVVGFQTKWSAQQVRRISNFLINMELPSEIHRQMRSLKYLRYWKGTELRAFLHYASFVVLKGMIPVPAYRHFLLFFCAITLLSTQAYQQHWEQAGQILDRFVNDFGMIHDKSLLSSNVHNIQHVYDDVCRFGALDEISSYPFENDLQRIKRLLRGGSRSLEQAVNRLEEIRLCNATHQKPENATHPLLVTKGHDITLHVTSNFMLKKGHRNEWFLTKDNAIMKYCRAAQEGSTVAVYAYKFSKQYEMFRVDSFSSTTINTFRTQIQDLSHSVVKVDVLDIRCKLVAIRIDNGEGLIVTPLLHTLT